MYNTQEVIDLYNRYQNCSEVARILNCEVLTVIKHLKSQNIQILSGPEVSKRKNSNRIQAIDLKTNEVIKEFNSQTEAGQWIINLKKSTIKDIKKIGYIIGRAARGLDNRKQAYGYKWIKI